MFTLTKINIAISRSFLVTMLCFIITVSSVGAAASRTDYSNCDIMQGEYWENHESSSISLYLEQLRARYDASIEKDSALIHVIIGNEAADLDSISAAIARAKHLSLDSMAPSENFYPVVNMPREDLALRHDAEYLFALLSVDVDSLLFIDEVPLDLLAAEGRLKLHLVDHNALAIHQVHLLDQVVSIIDHHADEHVYYPACPEENKMITTVGSVTSLVAREILKDGYSELDFSWATLMLAPILLDTANLQSTSKTTQLDIEAVQKLQELIGDCSLDHFFKRLRELRSDTEGFTADMLLRKDLKKYQEGELIYTISALPSGVEYRWDQDSTLLDTLRDFRKKKGVPIAMAVLYPHLIHLGAHSCI